MGNAVGDRVRTLRELAGWTQEHLAAAADVGLRTIQRLELGASQPRLDTLMALAAAFETDVSRLLTGLNRERLTELAEDCSCPTCQSRLVMRTFVEHEYGDCQQEVFECGSTRGWRDRPCPKDLRFPKFEDYKLMVHREDNGTYWCHAVGATTYAKAVELQNGFGETEEEAVDRVRRSYIAVRDGYGSVESIIDY